MAELTHLGRLKAVVGAYGANPERWPPEERGELERLARAPGSAAFIEEARELDMLLDAVPAARMSDGLAARIVAASRNTPRADPARVTPMLRRGLPMRRAMTGVGEAVLLAASLAGGLWLGGAGLTDSWMALDVVTASISTTPVNEDEANFMAALDVGEPSL